MEPTFSFRRHVGRSVVAGAVLAALIAPLSVASSAFAANSDIGYPVFGGDANPVPATGVTYTPGNELQAIFDADVAAGAGSTSDKDFWFDRMLARTGTAGSFGDNNQWLFTRGRAAFMKDHNPAVLGFGGAVAYWESIDGRSGYIITATVDGAELALVEDTTQRKQTPSYWRSVHRNDAAGIVVTQTKFITDDNVLVTELKVDSTSARTVTLDATSPYATTTSGSELTGRVAALNDLTTIYPRFSGDGFTAAGGKLTADLTIAAGGSATTKLQLGMVTDEIPESKTEYEAVKAQTPAAAYTSHVKAYNEWWAQNVPYLDTPEDNIDKSLYYRWWLMRFNFLDADMPGNTFQFPTAVEGALGYNNGIVLTTGMFIDDLKYFRDPIYSYGPWVAAGETNKSSKYIDNPGDPANWSNSYTEYISEAAWRSYQLHGGPTTIADNLAGYAEDDVKGLVKAYDTNGNGLIEYDWGAMTGNDADAVSFHWKSGMMDRTENAYLYSNALASAQAYRLIGNTAKADEMTAFAANIKEQVLKVLWNSDRKLFEHAMASTGEHNPWKEINNYYPFAVGLVPKPGDADYADDYDDALRLWADDKQYPIFPFYTANQADQAEYNATGGTGSNNFSVINSTVTFRMLSKVLRDYPTDAINAEWYKKLLYWNAWAHYQNGGDNRYPDQNEFWADGSADPQSINYRSWIHHTILGATNFTMIEDAMGLRPRSDAKVELDPIDIDWDHFTANNIRYRDKDLTITWDQADATDYYGSSVPDGYSVFLDGKLAFTIDKLAHVVYDPATGTVELPDGGATVTTAKTATLDAPQDVRFADDSRVVDVFAKAGADIRTETTGTPNLAEAGTATATFSADGRGPAGAIDGTTVNEPFWGTAGSPDAKDSLTIDLGGQKTFDDARVFFYDTSSSATVAGYSAPAQYMLEARQDGTWKTIAGQARTPAFPQANYNHVQFPEVTADAVRITVVHAPGAKTGVKELQIFDTGVDAPASTNQAPQVEAYQDAAKSTAGAAALVGSVRDDALPDGNVTSTWSVVSAPADATAIFDDSSAASTTVRYSTAGTYVLALTSTDGDKTSSVEVTVEGTTSSQGMNVASTATASAEFTAGWNNVNAVNDGKAFYTGGQQNEIWGTYGANPATRWLQYDWTQPVRVDGLAVDFWSDQTDPATGAGVNVPASWKAQYWKDGIWVDLPNPSEYGIERAATNTTTFSVVTTTKMRLTFTAAGTSPYAAVGVSEWQVFADTPVAIDPVDVRTTTGTVPTLPSTVYATYDDKSHAELTVQWPTIDPAKVAGEGSFEVTGIVAGSTILAKATVWVRATAPGQINSVDAVATTTPAGMAPVLPTTVGVLYNDGSREDLPVTWAEIPESSYTNDGQFTVDGTVQTSIAGPKATNATVTVGDGGPSTPDTSKPVTKVSISPDAPASGWYRQAVDISATATDNRDANPAIEVSLDGGAWTPVTAALSVTADGAHTVKARATDAAGNVSATAEASFKIDTTAPIATAVSDVSTRKARITATDGGSGSGKIEYRLDGSTTWITYGSSILLGVAETTVHYRATDVAGNVSAEATLVVPAGTGTVTRNLAPSATPSASLTAGWNSVNGLNDDVAPTSSGDVSPSDNANVWGAWPSVSDQWVQYDWTQTVSIDQVGVYFISNLDAAGLGIDVPKSWKVQYRTSEGAWTDVTGAGAYGTAVNTFNNVSFDRVTTTGLRLALVAKGTESTKGSLGIKEWEALEVTKSAADTTAPVVTTQVTPTTPPSGWQTTAVTVAATALDDRDTAPKLEVSLDGGAWATYTDAVSVSADGVNGLRFRAADTAGNVSEPVAVEVKLDRAAPTTTATVDPASGSVVVGGTVTARFTATDATSGVARTEVSTDGGASWSETDSAAFTDVGAHVVLYRSVDVAGNVEAVKSVVLAVSQFDVASTAVVKSLLGKAYLSVAATNTATVPVNVEITTAYGSKTFTAVAPGKTVNVSFNSKLAAVPAGAVSVTVTGVLNGVSLTETKSASYAAYPTP